MVVQVDFRRGPGRLFHAYLLTGFSRKPLLDELKAMPEEKLEQPAAGQEG